MIGKKRASPENAVDRLLARHERIGQPIKKVKTVFESKLEEINGCLEILPKDLSKIVFSYLAPSDLEVSSPQEFIYFAKEAGSQSLDFAPYWFDIFSSDLKNVSECHLVQSMNLSDCFFICDEALKHVANLPQIQSLNISCCTAITERGIRMLLKAKTLKSLNVLGCELPHRVIYNLKALLGLDELIY